MISEALSQDILRCIVDTSEQARRSKGWISSQQRHTLARLQRVGCVLPKPKVQPPPHVSTNTLDRITTSVMTQWMEGTREVRSERGVLRRAVLGVGYANGTCEGRPLPQWLLSRASGEDLRLRKTTVEAVRVLASAPALRAELGIVLGRMLRDHNRMVQGRAAAVIGSLGREAASEKLDEQISELLAALAEAAFHSKRAPLSAPKASVEITTHVEELCGYHPDAFVWCTAAAAAAELGTPSRRPELHQTLIRTLGSSVWLVRALSSVLLPEKARVGEQRRILEDLKPQESSKLQSRVRSAEALLFAGVPEREMLEALFRLLPGGWPPVQCACIDALVSAGRRHPELRGEIVQRLLRASEAMIAPVRSYSREAAEQMSGNLEFDLASVVLSSAERLLDTAVMVEPSPCAVSAEERTTCLVIGSAFPDKSELGSSSCNRLLLEIAGHLMQAEARLGISGLCMTREGDDLICLFRGMNREVLQYTDQLRERYRYAQHPLRFGLHAGNSLLVSREASGGWVLTGSLLRAAHQTSALAKAGGFVVSDTVAREITLGTNLHHRLNPMGRVSVAGDLDLPMYALEPAPKPTSGMVQSVHETQSVPQPSGASVFAAEFARTLMKLAVVVLVLAVLVVGAALILPRAVELVKHRAAQPSAAVPSISADTSSATGRRRSP